MQPENAPTSTVVTSRSHFSFEWHRWTHMNFHIYFVTGNFCYKCSFTKILISKIYAGRVDTYCTNEYLINYMYILHNVFMKRLNNHSSICFDIIFHLKRKLNLMILGLHFIQLLKTILVFRMDQFKFEYYISHKLETQTYWMSDIEILSYHWNWLFSSNLSFQIAWIQKWLKALKCCKWVLR